ncbi:dynein axonemal heavy chain 3-like [Cochliomyia hominivorax]
MTIRAPVPWKVYVQLARNHLDQVLMTTHPVIQALNLLWHQLYNDLVIVDISKIILRDIPMNADELINFIQESCDTIRNLLLNDWIPRCADMMDVMRKTWKDLIPMRGGYGGRAAILFRCVHALMSHHLEILITRSLTFLYKTLNEYLDGNDIDKYNMHDPKLKRRPLMTLIVSVIGVHFDNPTREDIPAEHTIPAIYVEEEDDANPFYRRPTVVVVETPSPEVDSLSQFILNHHGKFHAFPYIGSLPDLFIGIFKRILRVGYEIPRLEYVMSNEPDTFGYLHCIAEDHPDMLILYDKIHKIVENNWRGPRVYLLPIYKYYYALLSNKIQPIVEKIFTQHILPDLTSIENVMKKLRSIIEETYILRDFIPLNLFMLDNRHVKQSVAMLVQNIYDFIIDFYMAVNLNENRAICDALEEMSMKAGERPEETAEVVALQNYLAECRDEKIFAIKDEIKVVSKRVVFLLTHTILTNENIHLNTRTFILPSELEEVLDLSAARLSVVRDNLEFALREKRIKFEQLILYEKRRMDGFRVKETRDVLTLDELKERVETVDELFDILENLSREAKAINVEEQLLQIDITPFTTLMEFVEKMEPIEKLWKTAYQFEKDHSIWYS